MVQLALITPWTSAEHMMGFGFPEGVYIFMVVSRKEFCFNIDILRWYREKIVCKNGGVPPIFQVCKTEGFSRF